MRGRAVSTVTRLEVAKDGEGAGGVDVLWIRVAVVVCATFSFANDINLGGSVVVGDNCEILIGGNARGTTRSFNNSNYVVETIRVFTGGIDVLATEKRSADFRQVTVVIRDVARDGGAERGVVLTALSITLTALHCRKRNEDHEEDKAGDGEHKHDLDDGETLLRFDIHVGFLSFLKIMLVLIITSCLCFCNRFFWFKSLFLLKIFTCVLDIKYGRL